ncbi:MAG: glycosyltransferase family 1 protein [Opitutaceae bacterium]
MKVALVTETYPPEVNGVAMTLSRLTAGLAVRGHAVEVIRPRQKVEMSGNRSVEGVSPSPVAEYLVPGVDIPSYSTLRMGLPVRGRLRRRWQASRPDVVHVATEGPLGLAALSAARALHLPVTSSFHTNFHAYGGHYGLRLLKGAALGYLRWFHNRTLCTLVPTGEGARQLAESGFERTAVLARGVDGVLFHPGKRSPVLRRSWNVGDADPVVIYVGRIAAEKNLGLAVEAFEAVRRVVPAARFVLVGDGPERAALAGRNPHFIWAGVRRGEDLAAHYASADLFPFPSVTETFGNVVTEAMASGLVVVAFDYASAREHLRDGENGYTVPLEDRSGFVAKATAVAGARDAWPAIRARARETARDITWDSIIDRFALELSKAQAVGRAPAA